jgi:hypothetical protein
MLPASRAAAVCTAVHLFNVPFRIAVLTAVLLPAPCTLQILEQQQQQQQQQLLGLSRV